MREHWGFTVSLWGGTRKRARRAPSEDGVARAGPRGVLMRGHQNELLGAAHPRSHVKKIAASNFPRGRPCSGLSRELRSRFECVAWAKPLRDEVYCYEHALGLRFGMSR